MNRDDLNSTLAWVWADTVREIKEQIGREPEMGDCLLVAYEVRERLRALDIEATGYHGKRGSYPHWFVVCEIEIDQADEIHVIDFLGKAYYPEFQVSGDPKDQDMDEEYKALKKVLDAGIDHSRWSLDAAYRESHRHLLSSEPDPKDRSL